MAVVMVPSPQLCSFQLAHHWSHLVLLLGNYYLLLAFFSTLSSKLSQSDDAHFCSLTKGFSLGPTTRGSVQLEHNKQAKSIWLHVHSALQNSWQCGHRGPSWGERLLLALARGTVLFSALRCTVHLLQWWAHSAMSWGQSIRGSAMIRQLAPTPGPTSNNLCRHHHRHHYLRHDHHDHDHCQDLRQCHFLCSS